MKLLRQRLAALAVVALTAHAGATALVPLGLGCATRAVATAAVVDECCAAGSHEGVMCPMASQKARAGHANRECRLICANQDSGALFLLSGAAMPLQTMCLAAPAPSIVLDLPAAQRLLAQIVVPPSPPPRA